MIMQLKFEYVNQAKTLFLVFIAGELVAKILEINMSLSIKIN